MLDLELMNHYENRDPKCLHEVINRRNAVRFYAVGNVELRIGSPEENEPSQMILSGTLMDVSTKGLAVIMEQEIPVSSCVEICLKDKAGDSTLAFDGEVRWTKKRLGEKGCLMGVEFRETSGRQLNFFRAMIETGDVCLLGRH